VYYLSILRGLLPKFMFDGYFSESQIPDFLYSVSQLSPTPPLTPKRKGLGVGRGSSGVFHANENRYRMQLANGGSDPSFTHKLVCRDVALLRLYILRTYARTLPNSYCFVSFVSFAVRFFMILRKTRNFASLHSFSPDV
jgi:hypothetical protein